MSSRKAIEMSKRFCLLILFLLCATSAAAQEYARQHINNLLTAYLVPPIPSPVMEPALRGSASPDECFSRVGGPITSPAGSICPEGTRPKSNQGYVWGMTRKGNDIWFGTGANVVCLIAANILKTGDPIETKDFVCEFGQSQSRSGDFRPPRIYVYDSSSHSLEDLTPADSGLARGLRSAGNLGDVVLFAGPLNGEEGIALFAFDSAHRKYLGSHAIRKYSDIRKWIAVRNALYAAVQTTSNGRGKIIRWKGDCSSPFRFEEVGELPTNGANLAAYPRNRLAVSTWPDMKTGTKAAGVYLSPTIRRGGLTSRDRRKWKEVFSFTRYEPDEIVARTYAGGALQYYDGWLYWGTMHVPTAAAIVLTNYMEKLGFGVAEMSDVIVGTWRASTIWRGRYLETKHPEIQLLYGEKKLPRYQGAGDTFVSSPTGWKPLYGPSGFGNSLNTYAWEMAVANGSLFIGTLDVSGVLGGGIKGIAYLPQNVRDFSFPPGDAAGYGADIWRIDSSFLPAKLESRNGAGSAGNYGIRTMAAARNGKSLFLGSASPANLTPDGGWQFIELLPVSTPGSQCVNAGSHEGQCRKNAERNSRENRDQSGPRCRS